MSLLAYLVLRRDAPQSRQHLAFLFWPDSTEPQARTNLRHVLHALRHALPDPDRFLEVTSRTLQWRASTPIWLDVAVFEAKVAQAAGSADDSALAAAREAVELYSGDLLEGCSDEWLLGERERLRQRYLAALECLATLLEARGQLPEAIAVAERLLRLDPLREETYRLLMRLHVGRADRARALRVYHDCTATLERELGVEPSAPTRETYEALLRVQPGSLLAAPPTRRVAGPPLVGRAAEWQRLVAAWRAAETRGAQLVLVAGEPGIGKTRLVEEFRSWCRHRGAVTAEARAYSAEGALAYGPLVTWLRTEELKTRWLRLDRARLSHLAHLLPELFEEIPGLLRPQPLPEPEQRQRLFDAAASAILAAGAPLLLIADDLQWWDPDSLRFLHYLLRLEPTARLLVASTVRREEVGDRRHLRELLAGLGALGRFTAIDLERLSPEETTALAEHVAGRPFSEPEADQFFRETEGNPLFVVEALRAGWQSGAGARPWTSPRVQAVIESRLAQLSAPARDLVGLAATCGRAFTSDVLAHASAADEDSLVRSLDELWRRRIIREQGLDAYDFSHDKIREVAYQALSPAVRRRHHLRIAYALQRRDAHDLGPASGQIAVHFEQAGDARQAVAWYGRAAEAAQDLYANAEAIRLLDRALDLLKTLPETPERDARELELLTALPGLVGATEGYASARLAEAQRRARALAGALGVAPAPPLLRALAIASLASGDFEAACQVGTQLRARAEDARDDVLLVEAEYVLGIAAFWSGQLTAAQQHFETAVERYRRDYRRIHLTWYGQDPQVICLSRLANTLWFIGRPAAARRARAAACALADEIGHPFSRSTALVFGALLALDMRDLSTLLDFVRMLNIPPLEGEARQIQVAREILNAYLDVLAGEKHASIARIQQAQEHAAGAEHAPGLHAVTARVLLEACAAAGEVGIGLATADRALALGVGRLWEAELRRRRAEFLAALGAPPMEVEQELGRALDVARDQGSRMLELRAATSLLHHRLASPEHPGVAEVRERLAAIVRTLPEASETPDWREASALLAHT